jgi:4-oxalocrotonate tautomerase
VTPEYLTRHRPADPVCAPSYLDVPHTSSVVFVQITCNECRTVEMKKALFAKLAASIASGGVILPSDVIVSPVETKKENWSFGIGLAQYAT